MVSDAERTVYRAARARGWRAEEALRRARVVAAWDAAGGHVYDESYSEDAGPDDSVLCPGPVRLRVPWDECFYDDSYLDTWDDVPARERERVRRELWDRIERDGVVGIVGERWDGAAEEWVTVDSVWGFVGDDWRWSGYDDDVMRATLAEWRRVRDARAWAAACV